MLLNDMILVYRQGAWGEQKNSWSAGSCFHLNNQRRTKTFVITPTEPLKLKRSSRAGVGQCHPTIISLTSYAKQCVALHLADSRLVSSQIAGVAFVQLGDLWLVLVQPDLEHFSESEARGLIGSWVMRILSLVSDLVKATVETDVIWTVLTGIGPNTE